MRQQVPAGDVSYLNVPLYISANNNLFDGCEDSETYLQLPKDDFGIGDGNDKFFDSYNKFFDSCIHKPGAEEVPHVNYDEGGPEETISNEEPEAEDVGNYEKSVAEETYNKEVSISAYVRRTRKYSYSEEVKNVSSHIDHDNNVVVNHDFLHSYPQFRTVDEPHRRLQTSKNNEKDSWNKLLLKHSRLKFRNYITILRGIVPMTIIVFKARGGLKKTGMSYICTLADTLNFCNIPQNYKVNGTEILNKNDLLKLLALNRGRLITIYIKILKDYIPGIPKNKKITNVDVLRHTIEYCKILKLKKQLL